MERKFCSIVDQTQSLLRISGRTSLQHHPNLHPTFAFGHKGGPAARLSSIQFTTQYYVIHKIIRARQMVNQIIELFFPHFWWDGPVYDNPGGKTRVYGPTREESVIMSQFMHLVERY